MIADIAKTLEIVCIAMINITPTLLSAQSHNGPLVTINPIS